MEYKKYKNWIAKTATQFAEDKKKSREGDLTLCLLTGEENENADMTQLFQLMSRARNFSDSCCQRSLYQVTGGTLAGDNPLPPRGVIFKLDGFPYDALGETQFPYSVFTLDPIGRVLVPWDYRWLDPGEDKNGGNYENRENYENGENKETNENRKKVYYVRVYPLDSPAFLEVDRWQTVHRYIRPRILHPGTPVPLAPVNGEPRFDVDLSLTESQDIHEKKIDELRKELNAYERFRRQWLRYDKSSLQQQRKNIDDIRVSLDHLQAQVELLGKENSASLEVGNELDRQLENRISIILEELACLSGQEYGDERLVCIPSGNRDFHAMLLDYPLQVLRHIRFLPVHFKRPDSDTPSTGRDCYLLRFHPGAGDNPIQEHFLIALESRLGKSFITFRPDRRWVKMGVKVWLPEHYALKPLFFNYRREEQDMARQHIQLLVRSVWGENSRESAAIDESLASSSPERPPAAELVFVPGMKDAPGSRNWLEPGMVFLDENRFTSLADNVKLLNAQQSAIDPGYFTRLFSTGMDTALERFKSEYLLIGTTADLGKDPQMKKLLAVNWTGLLNDQMQRTLFDTFKQTVMEEAEAVIGEKTREATARLEKSLQSLQEEQTRLLAQTRSRLEALENYFQDWDRYLIKIQSAIDGFRKQAGAARDRFKEYWKARKKHWDGLSEKAKQLKDIETQFRRTQSRFNRLLTTLTLHFFVGAVSASLIVFLVYILLNRGGQP